MRLIAKVLYGNLDLVFNQNKFMMKKEAPQLTTDENGLFNQPSGDIRTKGTAGTGNPENEDGKVKPPNGVPDNTKQAE